jgi:hypothetical protein
MHAYTCTAFTKLADILTTFLGDLMAFFLYSSLCCLILVNRSTMSMDCLFRCICADALFTLSTCVKASAIVLLES